MTTKRTLQSLTAIAMLALILVSCNLVKSAAPSPTDTVGTNPDELKAKMVEVLEDAGTTLEKAEFSNITSSSNRTGSVSYSVSLEIVKPQNHDKLATAGWYSSDIRPNLYRVDDIVLSDADDNIIKEYDKFKDILFTYADIEQYINNAPACFKEALEASGYGADGFISNFSIEREQHNGNKIKAGIRVGYKGDSSLSKYFTVQEDGMHIIKK